MRRMTYLERWRSRGFGLTVAAAALFLLATMAPGPLDILVVPATFGLMFGIGMLFVDPWKRY